MFNYQYYWLDNDGKRLGPAIQSKLVECGVQGNTFLWRTGLETWTPSCKIQELQIIFPETEDYEEPVGDSFVMPAIPNMLEVEVEAEFQSLLDDNTSRLIKEQPNGFLMTLTTLSAYIMSSDKILMKSEKDFVTNFYHETFDQKDAEQYLKVLGKLTNKWGTYTPELLDSEMQKQCHQLASIMTVEDMQLLLTYLHDLAIADKALSKEEHTAISKICHWLGVSI